jgi:hypothetical protein
MYNHRSNAMPDVREFCESHAMFCLRAISAGVAKAVRRERLFFHTPILR